ncbi:MAG: hypothetical protein Q8Q09_01210 [Deltaproteobacteria bacterium]|nr:hypothetical protein [Deltaproteobacteria bacterium]
MRFLNAHVARSTLLATVCLALTQCVRPATAVVFVVETDLDHARPIGITARLGADLRATSMRSLQFSRGIATHGIQTEFPMSFTVLPQTDAPRDSSVVVWLDVDIPPSAGSTTPLRFTRTVRVRFTPNQTTQTRVFLSIRCGQPATGCPPGETNCTLARLCELQDRTCGNNAECVMPDAPTTVFDPDASIASDASHTMDTMDTGPSPDVVEPMDVTEASAPDASIGIDADAEASVPMDTVCVPNCAGRMCGDDGCGGTCGTCGPRANSAQVCNPSGQCAYTCNPEFGNCDGNAANGCEASLNTASNCGACGTACSGAAPMCDAMANRCVSGCATGQSRCGMACVDTQSDLSHCGACGMPCAARANSAVTCGTGACRYTCNAGFGDCDGNPANGCEASLNTASNCGACGTACSGATPVCDGARGVCASGCTAGQTRCGMSCVDTQNTLAHCGACGNACASTANAVASCAMGACGSSCNAGFGNCDGNAANGCETTLTSITHCGACGRTCSYANGTAACSAGTCALASCQTGFGNCDGNPANGCETALNTTSNCGACGSACTIANGTGTCGSGTCQVASCNAGFGNCDGNPANGCETALNSTSNCGVCGRSCSYANGNAACSAGTCALASCQAGWGNCDSNPANGCEAPLNSTSNCGACGSTCTIANGTGTCGAGTCQVGGCNTSFANCDSNPANGCEVNTNTNTSHCNGCGLTCPAIFNASPTCAAGTCGFTCNAGLGDCDGSPVNGCEAMLNTTSNCGACGTVCGATYICNGTSCVCPAGQAACGAACGPIPGTACARTCYTGSTWMCTAGTLFCGGGTPVTNGTSCGAADGRICTNGSCGCPAGQCYRCGECQGCTGPCQ